MPRTADPLDIALNQLRHALDHLQSALQGRSFRLTMPVHDQQEMIRREIATRQWASDPTGLMAGIGPDEYRARCGL